MEYRVAYYDDANDWIDTVTFVVNSRKELEEKSREYAEVLSKKGWDIAGWNYHSVEEEI